MIEIPVITVESDFDDPVLQQLGGEESEMTAYIRKDIILGAVGDESVTKIYLDMAVGGTEQIESPISIKEFWRRMTE